MTFCPPQAVCFDMDGVLLDTELLGGAILAEAAQLQGCTLLQAQQDALIGANMQSTKDAFERWFPGRIDGDRFILDWCRLMLSHIRRDGLPYKPGARETLVSLRERGLRLALCTSNAADVVAEYLHIAGWESAFDAVVTGDMVPHGKPAPDVYLLGAEMLRVPPAACVGVEDSVNGVKAVRAAGMHCVMIPDLLPFTDDLTPYVDHLLTGLNHLEGVLLKKE